MRFGSPPAPAAAGARRRLAAGFTLLELIIVVAIIGILATIAMPQLIGSPKRAKEAVLKNNLRTIRDTLDQYYADKGRYPASLELLVEEGYFRKVPQDPMTKSTETWVLVYEEPSLDEPLPEGEDGEGTEPGIIDVRSGAPGVAQDGTAFSEW
jgi:general secretion pathway protein G